MMYMVGRAYLFQTIYESRHTSVKTTLNVRSERLYFIHCVAKVYAVLPVSTVKCLYSGGRE